MEQWQRGKAGAKILSERLPDTIYRIIWSVRVFRGARRNLKFIFLFEKASCKFRNHFRMSKSSTYLILEVLKENISCESVTSSCKK
jgi:hypothetical protein